MFSMRWSSRLNYTPIIYLFLQMAENSMKSLSALIASEFTNDFHITIIAKRRGGCGI